ncbi:hypothetical protein ABZ923_40545 [Streptomyces sp. NPDC046881]|uniref:hypothetical protein n=1 Tax=Streptomyces sp. NPDC046881 TaxID=3155374 RepID=UPI003407DBB3
MYTIEQAEQLASEFLRRMSADWDYGVALFPGEKYRTQKGEFFYFTFQSAEYVATRDQKYYLYGPCHISVHSATGECKILGVQESFAIDPFNARERQKH